jgi:hypothetical protein
MKKQDNNRIQNKSITLQFKIWNTCLQNVNKSTQKNNSSILSKKRDKNYVKIHLIISYLAKIINRLIFVRKYNIIATLR